MARSAENDPLQKFKYKVSIPGYPAGMGFQTVEGLRRELETVEYREGGYGHTHKLTGQESVDTVTMAKGAFANENLEDLYKKSLQDPEHRKTITIELMDKYGSVKRTWRLAEAWVKSWEVDGLDAESSDPLQESIEIEFEHYL
jgi:phage tail-like protein